MNQEQQTLESFYQAFARRDHAGMAACYHPEVVFSDPVFPHLEGWRAAAMWRMLCERGKDLEVSHSDVVAGEREGSARWEARYTFSASGLPVHNKIRAAFEFQDGKIKRHTDDFDLRAWMGMALGWKGRLLGWAPPFQGALRAKAGRGLEEYIARHGLSAVDFFPG